MSTYLGFQFVLYQINWCVILFCFQYLYTYNRNISVVFGYLTSANRTIHEQSTAFCCSESVNIRLTFDSDLTYPPTRNLKAFTKISGFTWSFSALITGNNWNCINNILLYNNIKYNSCGPIRHTSSILGFSYIRRKIILILRKFRMSKKWVHII